MALPGGTNYDLATVTNPNSALTDFTLIVDLSTMSSNWWSLVDTADGTKGRAAIHASGTEVACDWIDFDNVGQTGFLRVIWSGTLSSSGTQQLRVYPPLAANSSYAATDTYGSYNAYDANFLAYWPLYEDPSGGAPQFTNRIQNAFHLTSAGSMASGDQVGGQVAGGIDFDGADDILSVALTGISDYPFMIMSWINPLAIGERSWIYIGNGSYYYIARAYNTATSMICETSSGFNAVVGTAHNSTDCHIAAIWSAENDRKLYTNGGNVHTDTATITVAAPNEIGVGAGVGNYFAGQVGGTQLVTTERSADWIAEEYSQTYDNATFWGSWAWQGGAGGTTPKGVLGKSILGPFGGPI